jgi:hypothetical protein
MTALLNPIRKALILSILAFVFITTGCHKNDYPCPGLGQSNEADMSLFDENGKLKDKKSSNRRISKDNGLVQKKKPKKLNAPRKTHL